MHAGPLKLKSLRKIFCVICLVQLCLVSGAMERLDALSMIESGNDDSVVGKNGERSRFQIAPDLIAEFEIDANRLNNVSYARLQAMRIMLCRCAAFQREFHRSPNDVEFYLLWHRPSRVTNPEPAEIERAGRFANLCQRREENPVRWASVGYMAAK